MSISKKKTDNEFDKMAADINTAEKEDVKENKKESQKKDVQVRELIEKKKAEIKKRQDALKRKTERETKKAEAETEKDLTSLNKKYKTKIVTFGSSSTANIEWLDCGRSELNYVISDLEEGGGWPRGRMIELYGPESSGKTLMLSWAYAAAQEKGLKVLHYDAEGTYNKPFSAMHGVDVAKLHYSEDDRCEKIFAEIEKFCENDEYDIIGIDSLAALVPTRMFESEMGKMDFSPLAGAIGRCMPKLSSAIKRSKTVVIFVNQVRDNVGEMYGDSEKTPGGRTLKFYASVRVDVRKRSSKRSEFSHLFNADGKPIGHRMRIKTTKNKVAPPYKECILDLMYQKPSRVCQIITEAIDSDVIERARKKDGTLWGRKLSYRGQNFVPEEKYSASEACFWLKENGKLCHLLEDMGVDDFDEFIESEDLTIEEVEKYLVETIGK